MNQLRNLLKSFFTSLLFLSMFSVGGCSASYRVHSGKAELDRLTTPTLEIEGVRLQYRDSLIYPGAVDSVTGTPLVRRNSRLTVTTPISASNAHERHINGPWHE